ncbi:MAG TPA: SBBP repeat-containing protein, partial [Bacillota bacterium]|nr:SBBP repeat-containing protein [Bacillota bacterium]
TAFSNVAAGPYDAFVAELNAEGTQLIYSTFLGGNQADIGGGIAVDGAGNAYVTGYTYSTNFPTVNAVQGRLNGLADAFVAKLAPGGKPLIYSTFLGGGQLDEGEGIAADDNGYAYVTGYTASKGFTNTPGSFQTNLNQRVKLTLNTDAFVTRLSPEGQIVYSTFLGGFYNDYGYRIATDGAGNALVTGTTQSTNFPVTVTATNLHVGRRKLIALNYDAFLTKLRADGSLAYSTVFGGDISDVGWGVTVDRASGSAFVIGTTTSTNFPVTATGGGFRTKTKADKDVFVVGFDATAANVIYSVVLGGSKGDFGYGIALDPDLNAYIVGQTISVNFPLVAPFQTNLVRQGQTDGFIGKISP